MELKHPWQKGPAELIDYAIVHLYLDGGFNQRIAFLLLDIGVETLMKVFLSLPENKTGVKTSYAKRKEAINAGFHLLVKGVQDAAADRIKGIDLAHIQYFHGIRNKLYHESDSITIPHSTAKEYAVLAVKLLDKLLGIDLRKQLESNQGNKKENNTNDGFVGLKEAIRVELDNLHKELEFCIEKIEPKLLLPTFKHALKELGLPGSIPDPWSFCNFVECNFGVDLFDCFSGSDKDIVNTHLIKHHGKEITQYPSHQKHIFLEVMSGFIDWTEFGLINLPVGDYKVHSLVINDFLRADRFQIYFKIMLEISALGKSDFYNAYWRARQYVGIDPVVIELDSVGKRIDSTDSYEKTIADIKDLCSKIRKCKY